MSQKKETSGTDKAASRPSAASTRRQFIKQGSTLAGVAIASPYAMADADTAPKKIRMGVVGGGMGSALPWHEHPDCVVEAVADLREDRRQGLIRRFAPKKVYQSIQELVRDKDVDAVAVFSDGPLHVEHTELAMKHGKHVISAVPASMGGGIEEAEWLLDIVKTSGLKYMMAETSYYQQATISARKFFQEGQFGDLFYCESQYDHPGLESLYFAGGRRTWRHGMPPMYYPTHCTAHLVGVTGERLVEVKCHGWGDDDPICQDNFYSNPFWSEMAMFSTNRGHAFRLRVAWKIAARGGETALWMGSKMSFHMDHPNGLSPIIVRSGKQTTKDDAGFEVALPNFEQYKLPEWWATDMLPEPMRHDSGHQGSHTFLANEFINALVEDRQPAVDIYEALAYTVPGIVAHESALRGGETVKIPQYDPT